MLAPPPLDRRLELVVDKHGVELRKEETTLATGRRARIDAPEIPFIDFSEAQEAIRRSSYDAGSHPLPMCFVCGPARVDGDGLRIIPGPLPPCPGCKTGTVAAPWVPYANLAGEDGTVASEVVWAALDCPTGFAGVGARHLGMMGAETILLGRMSAHIERRPYPGDQCVILAWPTGRDGRKLSASSVLQNSDGKLLAFARTTWLLVTRQVQLGE